MSENRKKHIHLILSGLLCFTSAFMPVTAEEAGEFREPDDTNITVISEEGPAAEPTVAEAEEELQEPVLPEEETEAVPSEETGSTGNAETDISETGSDPLCGEKISWRLDGNTLTLTGSGMMYDYDPAGEPVPWIGFKNEIETVILEEGITGIGDYAFYETAALKKADLPESLRMIGSHAFDGCSGLETVTFTGDIPSVGERAFASSAAAVYYPSDNETWSADARKILEDCFGSVVWMPDDSTVRVTFVIIGEDHEDTVSVSKEDHLRQPETAEKDGYCLNGWYTSPDLTDETKWDFGQGTVTADTVLYARWEPAENTVPAGMTEETETHTLFASVEAVVFGSEEISAYEDDTVQLEWTVTPEEASDAAVIFTSSDENVAYVDENGLVSCLEPGKTVIRAVSADGGIAGTCTLTVLRSPGGYSITYELGGGDNHQDNPEYYTGENTVILYAPVRNGYTFLGWYSDPAYKKKITSIPAGNTGDITLYAKWKRNTYKITYKLNGGKNPKGAHASYTVESETFRLVMPTRKGYAFGGWYKDQGFADQVISVETGSYGNLTLYAKWNLVHYGIAYALEEDAVNNALNPSEYTINDAVSFKNPAREGYSFKGWYSDLKLKKKVTAVKKGSTGEKILYPKWAANTFSVVFNANGGTGKAPKTLKCTYNNSYMIPANTFKLKGGTFTGWNTRTDGLGTWYEEYQEVNNLTSENKGKLTLYAQWEYTDFVIDYELNGGINNEQNPLTYTVNTPTIRLLEPTRHGYTFKGWYSDPQFRNAYGSIVTGSIGDRTVYAKWEPVKYNITYMLDGGENGDNPSSYTIESAFVLKEPQKTGFHSLGWFTDPDFTEPITEITAGMTGDLTLYAKWEGNIYYIKFDANGGSGTVPATMCVRYDELVSLPSANLTYSGLQFGGWNLSKFGTHTNYMPGDYCTKLTPRNGNTVTLYARWVLPTPSITSVTSLKYDSIAVAYGKVNMATEYEIVRSRTLNGTYLPDGTSTYTSYYSNNLTDGTTYYFKVRASYTDSSGKKFYSDYSSPVSGRTCLKPKFKMYITHLVGQSTSHVTLHVTNNGTADITIPVGNALFYPYSGATSTKMDIYGSAWKLYGPGGYYETVLPLYTSRIPQKDAYLMITFEYDGATYSAMVGDNGVIRWN